MANDTTYITRHGDTFDMMAIAAYNEERMASKIIAANPRHAGTLVFDEGVSLIIPSLSDEELMPETVAPWRR